MSLAIGIRRRAWQGDGATFDVETDLTYDVLRRILPTDALDMPQLDADRLVFDNSQPATTSSFRSRLYLGEAGV